MYSIAGCLVCGSTQRTIVAEYNRLIFNEATWKSDLARFDYALCHGCGLVYATRRPNKEEYDFLYANFNEFLMRAPNPKSFNVPELTAEMKRNIDEHFLPWWEVRSTVSGNHIHKRLRAELD